MLHFDSHLDTWDPKQLGGGLTKYSQINHGTMLHIAHEEGLLVKKGNMHVGSRCSLYDEHFDMDNDLRCGFGMIRAREVDISGVEDTIDRIVKAVGDQYLYLSVDVDVLDPGKFLICTSFLRDVSNCQTDNTIEAKLTQQPSICTCNRNHRARRTDNSRATQNP